MSGQDAADGGLVGGTTAGVERLAVALPMAQRAARLISTIAMDQVDWGNPNAYAEVVRLATMLAERTAGLASSHDVVVRTRTARGLARAQVQRASDTLDALIDERLRGHGDVDPVTRQWVTACAASVRAELARLDASMRSLPDVLL